MSAPDVLAAYYGDLRACERPAEVAAVWRAHRAALAALDRLMRRRVWQDAAALCERRWRLDDAAAWLTATVRAADGGALGPADPTGAATPGDAPDDPDAELEREAIAREHEPVLSAADYAAAAARHFTARGDDDAWAHHLRTRDSGPHAMNSFLTRRGAFADAGVVGERFDTATVEVARHMARAREQGASRRMGARALETFAANREGAAA